MAQQPFFTSYTPIARMDTRLAGSIGDRYAAGIQQGVQAFAAGIEKKRAADLKKQEDQQGLMFLKQIAPRLGLDPSDEETLKAGMKGLGGGSKVIEMAMMLQQHEQQTKLAAARAQQEQQAAQEAAAERAAMLKALGGEAGGDSIARYGAAGGADPRAVQALLAVEKSRQPGSRPEIIEPEPGVRVLWDGNNARLLPAAGSSEDFKEFEVGGRKMIVGPGNRYFDAKTGEPIAFGSGGEGDVVDKAFTEALNRKFFGGANPAAPADGPAPLAKGQTPTISTRAEFDALPAGARFVGPDGKEYQKPERKSPKGLSDLVTGG